MPQADENGVIELNVGKGEGGRITLVVENTGTEEVELKDITLLWKVNFFIYSDISSVGPDRGNLYAGNIFFFNYMPDLSILLILYIIIRPCLFLAAMIATTLSISGLQIKMIRALWSVKIG